jgi:hypothetical protein
MPVGGDNGRDQDCPARDEVRRHPCADKTAEHRKSRI